MDDLEATQTYFSPKTDEELEQMLASMGSKRPVSTFGAKLSPTMRDELGNPVAIDRNGNPINFEPNPDYDPDAKPSFDNFKKNVSDMAEGAVEGAKKFASDPLGTVTDTVNEAGQGVYEYAKGFGERIQTGQSTLGDVLDIVSSMMGVGPSYSVATKGVKGAVKDIQDPSMSRMFLTPGTKNLSDDVTAAFNEALDLENRGADPLDIKKQTGWENLAGKEWVYEIDDSNAHIKQSALESGATIDQEFTVPGGKLSPSERNKVMLQAKRDAINLEKDFKAGNLTEDEYQSLLEARSLTLQSQLAATTEPRTITKSVKIADKLKDKGKLEETFYHPELSNYLDTSKYTTNIGTLKGRKEGVWGDHDRYAKHINVYTRAPKEEWRGTTIHEVQHGLDAASGSPASGFNKDRSPGIQAEAKKRSQEKIKNFMDKKLENTLDEFNIYHFSQPITEYEFTDLMLESLGKDPTTGKKFFSEEFFKEALETRGNPNPDLTIRGVKENFPKTWNNIEDFAEILTDRDAVLSTSTDHRVYELELGETKARLADSRKDLTQEQRRGSLATNDIKFSDGLPIDINTLFIPKEYQ